VKQEFGSVTIENIESYFEDHKVWHGIMSIAYDLPFIAGTWAASGFLINIGVRSAAVGGIHAFRGVVATARSAVGGFIGRIAAPVTTRLSTQWFMISSGTASMLTRAAARPVLGAPLRLLGAVGSGMGRIGRGIATKIRNFELRYFVTEIDDAGKAVLKFLTGAEAWGAAAWSGLHPAHLAGEFIRLNITLPIMLHAVSVPLRGALSWAGMGDMEDTLLSEDGGWFTLSGMGRGIALMLNSMADSGSGIGQIAHMFSSAESATMSLSFVFIFNYFKVVPMFTGQVIGYGVSGALTRASFTVQRTGTSIGGALGSMGSIAGMTGSGHIPIVIMMAKLGDFCWRGISGLGRGISNAFRSATKAYRRSGPSKEAVRAFTEEGLREPIYANVFLSWIPDENIQEIAVEALDANGVHFSGTYNVSQQETRTETNTAVAEVRQLRQQLMDGIDLFDVHEMQRDLDQVEAIDQALAQLQPAQADSNFMNFQAGLTGAIKTLQDAGVFADADMAGVNRLLAMGRHSSEELELLSQAQRSEEVREANYEGCDVEVLQAAEGLLLAMPYVSFERGQLLSLAALEVAAGMDLTEGTEGAVELLREHSWDTQVAGQDLADTLTDAASEGVPVCDVIPYLLASAGDLFQETPSGDIVLDVNVIQAVAGALFAQNTDSASQNFLEDLGIYDIFFRALTPLDDEARGDFAAMVLNHCNSIDVAHNDMRFFALAAQMESTPDNIDEIAGVAVELGIPSYQARALGQALEGLNATVIRGMADVIVDHAGSFNMEAIWDVLPALTGSAIVRAQSVREFAEVLSTHRCDLTGLSRLADTIEADADFAREVSHEVFMMGVNQGRSADTAQNIVKAAIVNLASPQVARTERVDLGRELATALVGENRRAGNTFVDAVTALCNNDGSNERFERLFTRSARFAGVLFGPISNTRFLDLITAIAQGCDVTNTEALQAGETPLSERAREILSTSTDWGMATMRFFGLVTTPTVATVRDAVSTIDTTRINEDILNQLLVALNMASPLTGSTVTESDITTLLNRTDTFNQDAVDDIKTLGALSTRLIAAVRTNNEAERDTIVREIVEIVDRHSDNVANRMDDLTAVEAGVNAVALRCAQIMSDIVAEGLSVEGLSSIAASITENGILNLVHTEGAEMDRLIHITGMQSASLQLLETVYGAENSTVITLGTTLANSSGTIINRVANELFVTDLAAIDTLTDMAENLILCINLSSRNLNEGLGNAIKQATAGIPAAVSKAVDVFSEMPAADRANSTDILVETVNVLQVALEGTTGGVGHIMDALDMLVGEARSVCEDMPSLNEVSNVFVFMINMNTVARFGRLADRDAAAGLAASVAEITASEEFLTHNLDAINEIDITDGNATSQLVEILGAVSSAQESLSDIAGTIGVDVSAAQVNLGRTVCHVLQRANGQAAFSPGLSMNFEGPGLAVLANELFITFTEGMSFKSLDRDSRATAMIAVNETLTVLNADTAESLRGHLLTGAPQNANRVLLRLGGELTRMAMDHIAIGDFVSASGIIIDLHGMGIGETRTAEILDYAQSVAGDRGVQIILASLACSPVMAASGLAADHAELQANAGRLNMGFTPEFVSRLSGPEIAADNVRFDSPQAARDWFEDAQNTETVAQRLTAVLSNRDTFGADRLPAVEAALEALPTIGGGTLRDALTVSEEDQRAVTDARNKQIAILRQTLPVQQAFLESGNASERDAELINENMALLVDFAAERRYVDTVSRFGGGTRRIKQEHATGVTRSLCWMPFVGSLSQGEMFSELLKGTDGSIIQMLERGAERGVINKSKAKVLIERHEGKKIPELAAEGKLEKGAEFFGEKERDMVSEMNDLAAFREACGREDFEAMREIGERLSGTQSAELVREPLRILDNVFDKEAEILAMTDSSDPVFSKAASIISSEDMTETEKIDALKDLETEWAMTELTTPARREMLDFINELEALENELRDAINGLMADMRNRITELKNEILRRNDPESTVSADFCEGFDTLLAEGELGELQERLRTDESFRDEVADQLNDAIERVDEVFGEEGMALREAIRDITGGGRITRRNVGAVIDRIAALDGDIRGAVNFAVLIIATGTRSTKRTEAMWSAAESLRDGLSEHPGWCGIIERHLDTVSVDELNAIREGDQWALRRFVVRIATGEITLAELEGAFEAINRSAVNSLIETREQEMHIEFRRIISADSTLYRKILNNMMNLDNELVGEFGAIALIERSGLTQEEKERAATFLRSNYGGMLSVISNGPGLILVTLAESTGRMTEDIGDMLESGNREDLGGLLVDLTGELGKLEKEISERAQLETNLRMAEGDDVDIVMTSMRDEWRKDEWGDEIEAPDGAILLSIWDIEATESGQEIIDNVANEHTRLLTERDKIAGKITHLEAQLEGAREGHRRRKLQGQIDMWRDALRRADQDGANNKARKMAVAALILLRRDNKVVREVQVAAADALTERNEDGSKVRNVIELLTGEGKTTVGYMASYVDSLSGEGVFYVDTGSVLSDKTFAGAKRVLEPYGISIGHVTQRMDNETKQKAYRQNDIICLAVDTLAFDTNHDLDVTEVEASRRLIRTDRKDLKKFSVIVDELDSVLIDQALTSFITVDGSDTLGLEDTAKIIAAAMAAETRGMRGSYREKVEGEIDEGQTNKQDDNTVGVIDTTWRQGRVDTDKREDVLDAMADVLAPEGRRNEFELRLKEQLRRSGRRDQAEDETLIATTVSTMVSGIREEQKGLNNASEEEILSLRMKKEGSYFAIMEDALTACHAHEVDTHYTIVSGQVVLTHEMTGTDSAGQRLRGGKKASLHQLLEAKEWLIIRGEGRSSSEITAKQLFVDIYVNTIGMTGTLGRGKESDMLRDTYCFNRQIIPPHNFVRRVDASKRLFLDRAERENQVVEDVIENIRAGRPIMLNVEDIAQADEVRDMLLTEENVRRINEAVGNGYDIREEGNIQKFTAREEANKDEIKRRAAIPGVITIATAIGGRGVDIELTTLAKDKGMLVIALYLHSSNRVEMQLRGRAGRQGQEGETRVYLLLNRGESTRRMFDDAMRWFGTSPFSRKGRVLNEAYDTFDQMQRLSSEEGNERELARLRESSEELFDEAFDIVQQAREEMDAKRIKENTEAGDLKFSMLEAIREAQSDKMAETYRKARSIAPPASIIQEADDILAIEGANDYIIAREVQNRLGIMIGENDIAEARRVAEVTDTEFGEVLVSVLTEVSARENMRGQIDEIRKDFYEEVGSIMHGGKLTRTQKAKAKDSCNDTIVKLQNTEVTTESISTHIDENIAKARRNREGINFFTASIKREREYVEATEAQIEAREEERERLIDAGESIGTIDQEIRTLREDRLLAGLNKVAECYQELKTFDPGNSSSHTAVIDRYTLRINELREELGITDARGRQLQERENIKTKTDVGVMTRVKNKLKETLSGPRFVEVTTPVIGEGVVGTTVATQETQAAMTAASDVSEILSEIESNGTIMGEAVDLMDGSRIGVDGVEVLMADKDQLGPSLVSVSSDEEATRQPIAWIPKDDEDRIPAGAVTTSPEVEGLAVVGAGAALRLTSKEDAAMMTEDASRVESDPLRLERFERRLNEAVDEVKTTIMTQEAMGMWETPDEVFGRFDFIRGEMRTLSQADKDAARDMVIQAMNKLNREFLVDRGFVADEGDDITSHELLLDEDAQMIVLYQILEVVEEGPMKKLYVIQMGDGPVRGAMGWCPKVEGDYVVISCDNIRVHDEAGLKPVSAGEERPVDLALMSERLTPEQRRRVSAISKGLVAKGVRGLSDASRIALFERMVAAHEDVHGKRKSGFGFSDDRKLEEELAELGSIVDAKGDTVRARSTWIALSYLVDLAALDHGSSWETLGRLSGVWQGKYGRRTEAETPAETVTRAAVRSDEGAATLDSLAIEQPESDQEFPEAGDMDGILDWLETQVDESASAYKLRRNARRVYDDVAAEWDERYGTGPSLAIAPGTEAISDEADEAEAEPVELGSLSQRRRDQLNRFLDENPQLRTREDVVIVGFAQDEGSASGEGELFVMLLNDTDDLGRCLIGLNNENDDLSQAGVNRLLDESAGKEKGIVEIEGQKIGFVDTDDDVKVFTPLTGDEATLLDGKDRTVSGLAEKPKVHIDVDGNITVGDRGLTAEEFMNDLRERRLISDVSVVEVPGRSWWRRALFTLIEFIFKNAGKKARKEEREERTKDFIWTWREIPEAFEEADAEIQERSRGLVNDLRNSDDEAAQARAAAELADIARNLDTEDETNRALDSLMRELNEEIIEALHLITREGVNVELGGIEHWAPEDIEYALGKAHSSKNETWRAAAAYRRALSSCNMRGNTDMKGELLVLLSQIGVLGEIASWIKSKITEEWGKMKIAQGVLEIGARVALAVGISFVLLGIAAVLSPFVGVTVASWIVWLAAAAVSTKALMFTASSPLAMGLLRKLKKTEEKKERKSVRGLIAAPAAMLWNWISGMVAARYGKSQKARSDEMLVAAAVLGNNDAVVIVLGRGDEITEEISGVEKQKEQMEQMVQMASMYGNEDMAKQFTSQIEELDKKKSELEAERTKAGEEKVTWVERLKDAGAEETNALFGACRHPETGDLLRFAQDENNSNRSRVFAYRTLADSSLTKERKEELNAEAERIRAEISEKEEALEVFDREAEALKTERETKTAELTARADSLAELDRKIRELDERIEGLMALADEKTEDIERITAEEDAVIGNRMNEREELALELTALEGIQVLRQLGLGEEIDELIELSLDIRERRARVRGYVVDEDYYEGVETELRRPREGWKDYVDRKSDLAEKLFDNGAVASLAEGHRVIRAILGNAGPVSRMRPIRALRARSLRRRIARLDREIAELVEERESLFIPGRAETAAEKEIEEARQEALQDLRQEREDLVSEREDTALIDTEVATMHYIEELETKEGIVADDRAETGFDEEIEELKKSLEETEGLLEELGTFEKDTEGRGLYYSARALEIEEKYGEAIEKYDEYAEGLEEGDIAERLLVKLAVGRCHEEDEKYSKVSLAAAEAHLLVHAEEAEAVLTQIRILEDKKESQLETLGLFAMPSASIEDEIKVKTDKLADLLRNTVENARELLSVWVSGEEQDAVARALEILVNAASYYNGELERLGVAADETVQADLRWLRGKAEGMGITIGETISPVSMAVDHLRDTVICNPLDFESRVKLGDTLRKAGRLEEAIPQYTAVMRATDEGTSMEFTNAWEGLKLVAESDMIEEPAARRLIHGIFSDDKVTASEAENGGLLVKSLRENDAVTIDVDTVLTEEVTARLDTYDEPDGEADLETARERSVITRLTDFTEAGADSFEQRFDRATKEEETTAQLKKFVELAEDGTLSPVEEMLVLNGLLKALKVTAVSILKTDNTNVEFGSTDILGEMTRLISITGRPATRKEEDLLGRLSPEQRNRLTVALRNITVTNPDFVNENNDSARIDTLINSMPPLSGEDTLELRVGLLRREYTLNPSADIYVSIAELYNEAGHPRRAIEYLEEAIQFDRKSKEAHVALANVHMEQGHDNMARREAGAAVALDKDFAPAHLVLGKLHFDGRRYREALEEFRMVLGSDSANAEAIDYIRRIHELRPEGIKDSEFRLSDGYAMLDNGDYAGACESFLRALEYGNFANEGEMARAYYGLASSYESMGVYGLAADNYQRAIDHGTETADAYINLASCLERRGSLDEETSARITGLCDKAIEADGSRIEALEIRARITRAQEGDEKAAEEYLEIGGKYSEAGRHADAARVDREVLTIDPESDKAQDGRINALIASGDLWQAEVLLGGKEASYDEAMDTRDEEAASLSAHTLEAEIALAEVTTADVNTIEELVDAMVAMGLLDRSTDSRIFEDIAGLRDMLGEDVDDDERLNHARGARDHAEAIVGRIEATAIERLESDATVSESGRREVEALVSMARFTMAQLNVVALDRITEAAGAEATSEHEAFDRGLVGEIDRFCGDVKRKAFYVRILLWLNVGRSLIPRIYNTEDINNTAAGFVDEINENLAPAIAKSSETDVELTEASKELYDMHIAMATAHTNRGNTNRAEEHLRAAEAIAEDGLLSEDRQAEIDAARKGAITDLAEKQTAEDNAREADSLIQRAEALEAEERDTDIDGRLQNISERFLALWRATGLYEDAINVDGRMNYAAYRAMETVVALSGRLLAEMDNFDGIIDAIEETPTAGLRRRAVERLNTLTRSLVDRGNALFANADDESLSEEEAAHMRLLGSVFYAMASRCRAYLEGTGEFDESIAGEMDQLARNAEEAGMGDLLQRAQALLDRTDDLEAEIDLGGLVAEGEERSASLAEVIQRAEELEVAPQTVLRRLAFVRPDGSKEVATPEEAQKMAELAEAMDEEERNDTKIETLYALARRTITEEWLIGGSMSMLENMTPELQSSIELKLGAKLTGSTPEENAEIIIRVMEDSGRVPTNEVFTGVTRHSYELSDDISAMEPYELKRRAIAGVRKYIQKFASGLLPDYQKELLDRALIGLSRMSLKWVNFATEKADHRFEGQRKKEERFNRVPFTTFDNDSTLYLNTASRDSIVRSGMDFFMSQFVHEACEYTLGLNPLAWGEGAGAYDKASDMFSVYAEGVFAKLVDAAGKLDEFMEKRLPRTKEEARPLFKEFIDGMVSGTDPMQQLIEHDDASGFEKVGEYLKKSDEKWDTPYDPKGESPESMFMGQKTWLDWVTAEPRKATEAEVAPAEAEVEETVSAETAEEEDTDLDFDEVLDRLRRALEAREAETGTTPPSPVIMPGAASVEPDGTHEYAERPEGEWEGLYDGDGRRLEGEPAERGTSETLYDAEGKRLETGSTGRETWLGWRKETPRRRPRHGTPAAEVEAGAPESAAASARTATISEPHAGTARTSTATENKIAAEELLGAELASGRRGRFELTPAADLEDLADEELSDTPSDTFEDGTPVVIDYEEPEAPPVITKPVKADAVDAEGKEIEFGLTPGQRMTDADAAEKYLRNGGWKVSLTTKDYSHMKMDEWLYGNHKGAYALARRKEVRTADFHVYIADSAAKGRLVAAAEELFADGIKEITVVPVLVAKHAAPPVAARITPRIAKQTERLFGKIAPFLPEEAWDNVEERLLAFMVSARSPEGMRQESKIVVLSSGKVITSDGSITAISDVTGEIEYISTSFTYGAEDLMDLLSGKEGVLLSLHTHPEPAAAGEGYKFLGDAATAIATERLYGRFVSEYIIESNGDIKELYYDGESFKVARLNDKMARLKDGIEEIGTIDEILYTAPMPDGVREGLKTLKERIAVIRDGFGQLSDRELTALYAKIGHVNTIPVISRDSLQDDRVVLEVMSAVKSSITRDAAIDTAEKDKFTFIQKLKTRLKALPGIKLFRPAPVKPLMRTAVRPPAEKKSRTSLIDTIIGGRVNDNKYKEAFITAEKMEKSPLTYETIVIEDTFLEAPLAVSEIADLVGESTQVRIITQRPESDTVTDMIAKLQKHNIGVGTSTMNGFITDHLDAPKVFGKFVMLLSTKSGNLDTMSARNDFMIRLEQEMGKNISDKKARRMGLRIIGEGLDQGTLGKLSAILSISIDSEPALYLYGSRRDYKDIAALLPDLKIKAVMPIELQKLFEARTSTLAVERAM